MAQRKHDKIMGTDLRTGKRIIIIGETPLYYITHWNDGHYPVNRYVNKKFIKVGEPKKKETPSKVKAYLEAYQHWYRYKMEDFLRPGLYVGRSHFRGLEACFIVEGEYAHWTRTFGFTKYEETTDTRYTEGVREVHPHHACPSLMVRYDKRKYAQLRLEKGEVIKVEGSKIIAGISKSKKELSAIRPAGEQGEWVVCPGDNHCLSLPSSCD